MSDLIPTLRAIIREELTRHRLPELGVVTTVFAKEDDSGDGNHQASVTLRGSGVELQRVPVAVDRAGWSSMPRKSDLVVVAFLEGDINAPVIVGTVYNSSLRPPKAAPLDVVYQPPDEEDSAIRRFHLELPGGGTLTIFDDKLTIVSGGTEITVEKDGDVAVKSAGNVKIESEGDITMEAGGKISIKAQQDVTVEGMSSTVKGQSSATLKGASISLAGMTSFSAS